jgi:hypothetical protein
VEIQKWWGFVLTARLDTGKTNRLLASHLNVAR